MLRMESPGSVEKLSAEEFHRAECVEDLVLDQVGVVHGLLIDALGGAAAPEASQLPKDHIGFFTLCYRHEVSQGIRGHHMLRAQSEEGAAPGCVRADVARCGGASGPLLLEHSQSRVASRILRHDTPGTIT